MATTLYFRHESATVLRATNTARLNGSAPSVGWNPKLLTTTRGAGVQQYTTDTVAGATNGVEVTVTAGSGSSTEWISDPVDADVTISGTITANIWGRESDMNANVAINVIIDILRANSVGSDGANEIVNIVKSTRTTEMAVSTTTNSVSNFTTGMTSGGYTGQTLNKGDRLRVRIFGDDVGTMGSGFTFGVGVSGTTGAANGDTFITFNETFSFMTLADPGGTQIFFTVDASTVSTASVDLEAWTTAGASSTTSATNTVAGFANPTQMTQSAGGTVLDWFTKPLQAVTLTGLAWGQIRLRESNVAAITSARLEIARVANDGTSPTVWSTWNLAYNATATGTGALDATGLRVETFWMSGDDLAISDEQRIRIRMYIDDANAASVSGHTATIEYDQSTTFVTFTQTLAEFTGGGTTYTKAGYGKESG